MKPKYEYWDILYMTFHGDFHRMMIPVPIGTHSFKIRGIAKKRTGLESKIIKWKKVKSTVGKPMMSHYKLI